MWKGFQAIRFGLVGVCLVSIVMVMAGCTEALTPIDAVEHGNATAVQMAGAEDGDATALPCDLDMGEYIIPGVGGAAPGTFLAKWEAPQAAMAVDSAGNVFVVGFQFNPYFIGVKKFSTDGALLAQWDTYCAGACALDGKFRYGSNMTVDSAGNVYIADKDNHRIQKFDANGAFLTKWGSKGTGDGQFESISGMAMNGVAVDRADNIYVVDDRRIQKFDANGTFITKWEIVHPPYWMNFPNGVAVDRSGDVYVTDTGWSAVWKYDANGTFLMRWGTRGSGDGQFEGWYGLPVTTDGSYVYVLDTGNYRVQKFDLEGNFLAKWGSEGRGDGQFASTLYDGIDYGVSGNVAVDQLHKVYVLDGRNHRVQKFCGGGI